MPATRVKVHARRVCRETPSRDVPDLAESLRAGPNRYRIRVKGQLDPSWGEALGGLEVVWDEEDNTVLVGELSDQSALRGVLTRLFDLGSLLLSVEVVT
jgi:hypothetical protein